MKTLYLDCFSGISGNMFIGMLIQAGVPFEAFKQAMASLNLTGYDLVCHSVNKLGIQSIYYNVLLDAERHDHGVHDIMSITTMNRDTNTMNTTRIMGKSWPARAISSI